MYRNRNPLLATWCVAVVAWCSSAGAQVPASGLITLDFPGGTVTEYVAALRSAGDDPSIVVMPEAADLPVPALELNSVALQSALQLIAGEAILPGGRMVRSQLVGFESDEGRTVWRVSATSQIRGRPETPEVSIWSVSDLLSGTLKTEAILSAVETAVELIDDPQHTVQIRFHEDTALLMAHGTDAQRSTVEEVLLQLQMAEPNRAQDPVADLFDWIQEMKKLDDTQEGSVQALEEAVEKIAELSKLIEQKDQEIAELKRGSRVKQSRGGEGRAGRGGRGGGEGRGGRGERGITLQKIEQHDHKFATLARRPVTDTRRRPAGRRVPRWCARTGRGAVVGEVRRQAAGNPPAPSAVNWNEPGAVVPTDPITATLNSYPLATAVLGSPTGRQ